MSKKRFREDIAEILSIGGIRINGPDLWDIQIHNEGFYGRVLKEGSLGLGESYVDGWWDCEQLDGFVFRIMRADLYNKARLGFTSSLNIMIAKIFNMQAKK